VKDQPYYKSGIISPEYQAHAGDKRVDRKLARPYHLGIVGLSEKD